MDYTKLTNQDLEQLIEQKDLEATCEMADRCLNGTYGVEQNLNRAYQLYHRAESKGSKRAYIGLAYMYEHGILFGQNIELAKKYYAMADVEKTEFAEEQERKKHYVEMESGPREPVRVGADGQVINQIVNEAMGISEEAADESRQHLMEMAVSRAQEAAEAARIAAVKAQEAAAAADKAAEYAKKACL